MSKKAYWNMTAEELAEATREFDEEDIDRTFRPMSAHEEAQWRSLVNKRSRSGARKTKKVQIGIDERLLRRADDLAKRRGVSRATLVAEGLQAVLTLGQQPKQH